MNGPTITPRLELQPIPAPTCKLAPILGTDKGPAGPCDVVVDLADGLARITLVPATKPPSGFPVAFFPSFELTLTRLELAALLSELSDAAVVMLQGEGAPW